jgi:hypothetical protein
MAALDLCRKEVISGEMSVVICNEAAMQQPYTHGNNAAFLRHFFLTQLLLC